MAFTAPTVVTSGTTDAQLPAAGFCGVLENLIALAANAGPIAQPTAPTLSESGSGGTLPAGTYYVKVTESNGFGESVPSAASSSQAITLGEDLVVTFASLQTNAVSRDVYVSSDGTNYYLAGSGITASTFTISAPLPSNSYAVTPPTADTTALTTGKKLEYLRAAKSGNLQRPFDALRRVVTNFNAGDPVSFRSEINHLRDALLPFAFILQVGKEIGTLFDANAGTLKTTINPIGNTKSIRTQP